MNNLQKITFIWSFLVFFTGCNYQAGFSEESKEFSLSLHFKNNSKAFQFIPLAKRIVKEEFFRIPEANVFSQKGSEPKDYVVKITFSDYRVGSDSFRSSDTIVAQTFRSRMMARMQVIEQKSGNQLLDRNYSFIAATQSGSDFEHQGDRQLQVSLARDMGQRMSRDVLENIR